MNKEKDFFKTCFNIVASLDVKNESAKLLTVITHEQMEQMAYNVEE